MSSAERVTTQSDSFTVGSPLQKLLAGIRDDAQNETEKGTFFEDLCVRYLLNEPEYRALYSRVEHFRDWVLAHSEAALARHDLGIDLVATTKSGEFHAVQCKNYAPDYIVAKKDVDSFLAASGNQIFTGRLIIDTTHKPYGANAEAMLTNQSIPVQRIDLTKLASSQIDWSHYQPEKPGVVLKEKHVLRPHQREALTAVLSGLQTADRGKLIMACGTGKTFTALKIAEASAGAGKNVLFLVPSLALLSQTLTEWCQQTAVPITAFAVCSDQ